MYNEYIQHLNLNFSPVTVGGNTYQLTPEEQTCLEQKIITNWIYFYTVNNLQVTVEPSDFKHPYTVDWVIWLLDEKFAEDTPVSLAIGASILRRNYEDYCKTVEGRRWYYNR